MITDIVATINRCAPVDGGESTARSAGRRRAKGDGRVEERAALARHRAFWGLAQAPSPLVSTSRYTAISASDFDLGIDAGDGIIEAECIQVEHLLTQYERMYADRGAWDGDLLWPAIPPRPVPWLEAIAGCPIYHSASSGTFFPERAVTDPTDLRRLTRPSESPWFSKLLELTAGIVTVSRGRYPVAFPILRGPWDVAAALMGSTELYLALIDSPVEVVTMAEGCADLWLEVSARLWSIIPRWHGGYTGLLGIWSPSPTPLAQDDFSAGVSAETYGRLMAPVDRRPASHWTNGVFHLHSAGLQVLDSVLEWAYAVNVVLDPTGPSEAEVMKGLRHVQQTGHPLHVYTNDWDQAERIAHQLRPAGLAITYQPPA